MTNPDLTTLSVEALQELTNGDLARLVDAHPYPMSTEQRKALLELARRASEGAALREALEWCDDVLQNGKRPNLTRNKGEGFADFALRSHAQFLRDRAIEGGANG